MKEIIDRYDPALTRSLEIISASVSFILLSLPIWGALTVPELAAYFIILFDVYWLYKSIQLAVNGTRSYLEIKKTVKVNWYERSRKLPGYDRLRHIIFIPNVNEPEGILRRTLTFLANQEFDTKKISVVLATETKVPTQKLICENLAKEFSGTFGKIWVTQHLLQPREVVGKSSNLSFASRAIKKEVERLGWDKSYLTITSCDADVSFHDKYFALLSYKFLTNPQRYLRFWQAPILFYNNIWRVPMPIRIINTVYSIAQLADVMRPHTTFNFSSYSLSWRLVEESDFWDVDVIPEDWHLFFKTFFSHQGLVDLESLSVPLYADAAEGNSYWSSVRSNYVQVRRWAWGVTDLAYALKMYLKNSREVPLSRFIFRYGRALEHHTLWPANWFIITFGATIPALINPAFKKTALGFSLPGIAGFILTFAIVGLLSIIVLDILMRPPRPESFKKWHLPILLIQYLFMPLTAFVFGSLPGMDAHMRLILGKRLEYKVTEKRA
jgi:cellulose synthase/poly-beta-1,6-N-acetylglucosamine synthase-like glycosyltransferase